MKKEVVTNNKGYKTITNVLWVVAVLSMMGLLIATNELSKEVKDIKRELILHRK
jgi:hypothetical protein